MVSTSISLSEQMADLYSDTNRLLATWMIPHLDREGRCSGSPRQLQALVTPLLTLDGSVWPAALNDMERVGLIRRYVDAAGQAVVEWPRFAEHQTGLRPDREAPSKFGDDPDPDPDLRRDEKRREVKRARAHASGPTPEDSGPTPELDTVTETEHQRTRRELVRLWPELREDIEGQLSLWVDAYPGIDLVQLAREAKAKARAGGGKVERPAALLGRWFQRAWNERQSEKTLEFEALHAARKRNDAAERRLAEQLSGPKDAKPIGDDVRRLLAVVKGGNNG